MPAHLIALATVIAHSGARAPYLQAQPRVARLRLLQNLYFCFALVLLAIHAEMNVANGPQRDTECTGGKEHIAAVQPAVESAVGDMEAWVMVICSHGPDTSYCRR